MGLQAVLIAGATAIAQVLVAVIYIVTARDTDPATYGAVVTAIAVGTSAAGLVDFGSNAFWTREAASGRTPATGLGARVSGKLLLALALAVTATVVTSVVAPAYLAAGAILVAVLLGQTMLIPLRALRRGETVALLVLIERVAAVLLFGLLSAIGVDPTTALWIALALGTLTLAAMAGALTPTTERMQFFGGWPRNPWAGSRHYGWSSIAASAQQLDLPLLGIVAGPAAAGLYGAVNRWTQPMQLLSGAFSSASAPFIAQAEGWSHARRIVLRSSWMLFVAVGVCIALAITAPVIVPFLLGDQYDGSAEILQWLALGTIPAIFNQPIVSALQARRYDHLVAIPWLVCVAIQLALIVILGPLLGALAAAIAFTTLQVLLFAVLTGCLVYAVRTEVSSTAR
ncbi:lipopolysaccharide biosynthesis protein [Planococcus sp. APC 4015]|nr:lipopolysaccharide biosynthesis protein [Planococcus sp. APC 4015]